MSNKGSKTLAVVCAPQKPLHGVVKTSSFKNGSYLVHAINERTEVPFSVIANKVTYHISSTGTKIFFCQKENIINTRKYFQ